MPPFPVQRPMILFELKCSHGHGFEAWFRNGAAYDEQAEAGAVACPVCGDTGVSKAPMAPRIAKSGAKARDAAAEAQVQAQLIRELREIRRKVEENADYVGDRFAEEARKIHYGEVETRAIYGETTPGEAADLHEEGVPFARIPWLPGQNS